MNGNNIFYFETAIYPNTTSGYEFQPGELIPMAHRIFQVLDIKNSATPGLYRVRLLELTLILEQAAPPQEGSDG